MKVVEPTEASISGLFTPTVIFCILNLMIGTIFISSLLKFQKKQEMVDSPPGQLVRVHSFIDRVKSFNFSSYRSEQPDPSHPVNQHADPHEEQEQMVEEEEVLESHQMIMRSKSETSVEPPLKGDPGKKMKKSASEKAAVVVEQQEEVVGRRQPATVRERKGSSSETAEDQHVDKKADDFINRFRQQLKLQRLDSLLRYKEMLNRGVGR